MDALIVFGIYHYPLFQEFLKLKIHNQTQY